MAASSSSRGTSSTRARKGSHSRGDRVPISHRETSLRVGGTLPGAAWASASASRC